MRFDIDDLPSEPALLQHLIRDLAAAVEHRDGEIERLKSIIKTLQRAQFAVGSSALIPISLRSKTSTATSPVRRRSARMAKSKPANGLLVANR